MVYSDFIAACFNLKDGLSFSADVLAVFVEGYSVFSDAISIFTEAFSALS
jgi:hypothetical protein